MRSAAEIRFRLRQRLASYLFFRFPPRPRLTAPWPLALPDAAYPTVSAAELGPLGEAILAHRFPLLGVEIETGPEIRWRRDYLHGQETGLDYFFRIPYLDFAQAGDHKIIWELNRHAHLAVLARLWRDRREARYRDELARQLDSWLVANPFHRGINWASALEVAFRALNWLWVWQWAGPDLPAGLRARFLTALWQHGLHLEYNLSYYFSPNTHLWGEALALHALGTLFPSWPRAAAWRRLGRRVVLDCALSMLRPDGSYFEQSSYYHVYAVDFLAFHHALEPLPAAALDRLYRARIFLDALLGPPRRLPLIGDDDGGRLFHPYGPREEFGRASLEALASLGPLPPRPLVQVFPDAGLAVIEDPGEDPGGPDGAQILFDAGPFGSGTAGHSHADMLAVLIRRGEEEILIDPGTYTYITDPVERHRFRSTPAHNTIRAAETEQADPAGPFRWRNPPVPRLEAPLVEPGSVTLAGEFSRLGLTFHRRLLWDRPAQRLTITDTVTADSPGPHTLEQFWHLGSEEARSRFSFDPRTVAAPEPAFAWRSRAFGHREPAPCWVTRWEGRLPVALTTVIQL